MTKAAKTIVITGASAGIGVGMARRLAADGHRLEPAVRRREALDTIAHAAEAAGSPRVVAAIITRAIENPVVEVYTNPASAGMAQTYFADVAAFEASGATWGR